MMRRKWPCALILLLIPSACGGGVAAEPERVPWPTPDQTASPTAELPDADVEPNAEEGVPAKFIAEAQTTAEELQCGEDPLAIAFGVVDGAAGHRLLGLSLRNCSDGEIVVDELSFVGLDSMLRERALTSSKLEPKTLAFKEDALIEVEWLGNGRCERGIQRLTVTVEGQTHTREDCFQMGGALAPERDTGIGLRWM